MEIIKTVSTMSELCAAWHSEGARIGFVPTMGYLHQGHFSLIKQAIKENDKVIVSVFVNPSQFAPNEDFEAYPRDLAADSKACAKLGVDVLFAPEAREMYPEGFATYVDPTGLSSRLCGKTRPTHFRGVCTVVLQLLNLIEPFQAYFGQKDAQQCLIVKRMLVDLHLAHKVTIKIMPIIREPDGLAISSRNVYLNAEERAQAVVLSQALKLAEQMYEAGERDSAVILRAMQAKFDSADLAKIDYMEIVDTKQLLPIEKIEDQALVAMAVYFGKTRLIDNTILDPGR